MDQKTMAWLLQKEEKISGWLVKQGDSQKSWKKRWCSLRGKQLIYFKGENDTKPHGVIPLVCPLGAKGDFKVRAIPETEEPKKKFCFVLEGNFEAHKSVFFCALSSEDRDKWMDAIGRVIYARVGGGMFGNDLQDQMKRERKGGLQVPEIVEVCIKYLRERGMKEEGIFRLPGKNTYIKELRRAFHQGEKPQFLDDEVMSIASLVKSYIRELPTPLLLKEHYGAFVAASKEYQADPEVALTQFDVLLTKLPQAHLALIKFLCEFLSDVAEEHEANKMDLHNLALIFAPSFLLRKTTNAQEMAEQTSITAKVVALLIDNHELLFAKLSIEESEKTVEDEQSNNHVDPNSTLDTSDVIEYVESDEEAGEGRRDSNFVFEPSSPMRMSVPSLHEGQTTPLRKLSPALLDVFGEKASPSKFRRASHALEGAPMNRMPIHGHAKSPRSMEDHHLLREELDAEKAAKLQLELELNVLTKKFEDLNVLYEKTVKERNDLEIRLRKYEPSRRSSSPLRIEKVSLGNGGDANQTQRTPEKRNSASMGDSPRAGHGKHEEDCDSPRSPITASCSQDYSPVHRKSQRNSDDLIFLHRTASTGTFLDSVDPDRARRTSDTTSCEITPTRRSADFFGGQEEDQKHDSPSSSNRSPRQSSSSPTSERRPSPDPSSRKSSRLSEDISMGSPTRGDRSPRIQSPLHTNLLAIDPRQGGSSPPREKKHSKQFLRIQSFQTTDLESVSTREVSNNSSSVSEAEPTRLNNSSNLATSNLSCSVSPNPLARQEEKHGSSDSLLSDPIRKESLAYNPRKDSLTLALRNDSILSSASRRETLLAQLRAGSRQGSIDRTPSRTLRRSFSAGSVCTLNTFEFEPKREAWLEERAKIRKNLEDPDLCTESCTDEEPPPRPPKAKRLTHGSLDNIGVPPAPVNNSRTGFNRVSLHKNDSYSKLESLI